MFLKFLVNLKLKINFLSKLRISAQNRIRPSSFADYRMCLHYCITSGHQVNIALGQIRFCPLTGIQYFDEK